MHGSQNVEQQCHLRLCWNRLQGGIRCFPTNPKALRTLEDAACLGEEMTNLTDTAELPERFGRYEARRRDRASRIQSASFGNRAVFLFFRIARSSGSATPASKVGKGTSKAITGRGPKVFELWLEPDGAIPEISGSPGSHLPDESWASFSVICDFADDVRLSREDEVYLGGAHPRHPLGRPCFDLVFAVAHKRHGQWTHLYRVTLPLTGIHESILERVIARSEVEQVARWAARRLAIAPICLSAMVPQVGYEAEHLPRVLKVPPPTGKAMPEARPCQQVA